MIFDLPMPDLMPMLTRLLMAGVRPVAMLAVLPGFAGLALPWRARLAMAWAMAAFVAFGLPERDLSPAQLPTELVCGLSAGLATAMAFAAAGLAGELVGQMLGLGFAAMASGGATVIGGWFGWLMVAAWLAADGPLLMFGSIVALPPEAVTFDLLAHQGAALFAGALSFALPAVALLLLGNLLVALVSRSAPQLGSLSIGPPVLLLALMLSMPWLGDALSLRAARLVMAMQELP